MNRSTFRFVAILIGVAVLVGPAPAQFTGQGVGGQYLLFNKSVQEELKLTQDQLTRLRTDAEAVLGGFKDQLAKLKDMDPEARAKVLGQIAEKTNKVVTSVLDKDQVKRLREIDLQQRGPLALYDEEVRKTLKITDEQLGKLKTLADTSFQELHKAHEARDEKKMAEVIQAATEKVIETLTPQQRQTWKEMVGKPFTPRLNRE